MHSRPFRGLSSALLLVCLAAWTHAQSFRVQCPTATITHPDPSNSGVNSSEPAYNGPTQFGTTPVSGISGGYVVPQSNVNGAIKCQQVSGGDGYSTMANGTQTFMFSFGPLSGLADIANGHPGTQFPAVFNTTYPGTLQAGDPATTNGMTANTWPAWPTPDPTNPFSYNGAVGTVPDLDQQAAGLCGGAGQPSCIDGHVDPHQIMNTGVMNGNIPAPLVAIDEDDEFFLTLTNVGMIMRPDLFEQHTIHFHGYPNASSVFDGVPDASVAINIGGSFSYYYLAPDAGTYFWHCHITPPEHLQMGMVGQLYVRPRQNRVTPGANLRNALLLQNGGIVPAGATPNTTLAAGADLRTVCNPATDILCSAVTPPTDNGAKRAAAGSLCSNSAIATSGVTPDYTYNDGDGSTCYDVEYPLQIHGFDPNFHFVGMTFNPEGFVDMKDKFFLLNGRSYPDTVTPGPMATQTSDGRMHYSQPLPAIINIPAGGRALLRIADLDVAEYQTLASLGIPMKEVGFNAKLLRDQEGNNLEYYTNSVTLGGGESQDVLLDASDAGCGSTGCAATLYPPGSTFYLYTTNLDHLSNDQENFGGLMTEVHICNSVSGGNTYGNTCN